LERRAVGLQACKPDRQKLWMNHELDGMLPGTTKVFPASLSSWQRRIMHGEAAHRGWTTKSVGEGTGRQIYVTRPAHATQTSVASVQRLPASSSSSATPASPASPSTLLA
jgi:hypothetical protein